MKKQPLLKSAAAVLLCCLFLLSGMAVLADVSEKVEDDCYTVFADFNGKTVGDDVNNDFWGNPVKDSEYAQRADGDVWIKFTNNADSASNQYQGVQIENPENSDDPKYTFQTGDMIGFYLKFDAADDKTSKFVFKMNSGSGDIFEKADADWSYKLLTDKGVQTDKNDVRSFEFQGGYEGWIVFPLDVFASVPAALKVLAINFWEMQDVDYYMDDILIIHDLAKFKEGLAKEDVEPPVPPTQENFTAMEDFNDKTAGAFPEGEWKDARGSKLVNGAYAARTGTDVENDKWMTFDGRDGEQGSWYYGMSAERKAIEWAEDTEAFAMYLKLEDVSGETKFRADLRDGGGCDFRMLDGGDKASKFITISKDGELKEKEGWAAWIGEEEFEGWIIIPLENFEYRFEKNEGHDHNVDDDRSPINAKDLKSGIVDFSLDVFASHGKLYFDDFGMIRDVDKFIEDLGAAAPVEDITLEMTPETAAPVGKAVFEGLKADKNKLTVTMMHEDGYELYTWTFDGATITNPMDFNPLIQTDFAELAALQALTGEDGYFIKTGELPGPATLSIELEDTCLKPYVYKYAGGVCTLLRDEPYTMLSGYVDITLESGGVYYFSDTKIGEEKDDDKDDDDDDNDDDDDDDTDPVETGVGMAGGAFVLLAAGAGVLAAARKKNRS